MIFGIDIDIANLIVQAFIGLVTLVALIVAFWQGSQSKRNREDDIKRYQPSRISAWYEGGRNRTGQPEDNRFVWQFVVLRNESESPVYDAIVTCVGISGAGPSFKGEDNRPVFPNRVCVGTLPPGAWYIWLPTEGHGMGVARRPKRLSPTQTEHRGFGEATEGSRRFLWSRPRSTGCPSPCPGADAKS